MPWFFMSGTPAVLALILIGAKGAVALGATSGSFSAHGVAVYSELECGRAE